MHCRCPSPILHAVRLLRNPRLTVKYFLQGVAECALRHIRWPPVLTRIVTGSIVVALAGLWGLLHATCAGQFDSYFIVPQDNDQGMYLPSQYASWLISATREASFWIGCGILSTAGLGSGVQVSLSLSLYPRSHHSAQIVFLHFTHRFTIHSMLFRNCFH